jgi:U3 small nucleolar ribonucleoprotein component
MATITLEYDARDKKVNTLLRAIMESGATAIGVPRKKTGIDDALEDVRLGRVNTYKTIDDLLQKING